MGRTICIDNENAGKRPSGRTLSKYRSRQAKAKNKTVSKLVKKALTRRGLGHYEQKYKTELNNTGVMGNTLVWASSSNVMNEIQQGDGHADRDGFRIQPVRIQARIHVACANGTSALARILIIRWDDTAVPTMADIFESPATSVCAPNAMFNLEKRKMFKVYFDRTFDITSLADADGRRSFNISIDCKSHKECVYTSSLFDVANMTQGRYYILYFSNQASNGPNIEWTSRFTFTG